MLATLLKSVGKAKKNVRKRRDKARKLADAEAKKGLTPVRQRQKSEQLEKIEQLYKESRYLDAYRDHTDLRVASDPKAAIGGLWEEVGRLQFDFLKNQGMLATHRVLDIGCGTLRGGRLIIPYLKTGMYTGVDISPKAIEFAQKLIVDERLVDKHPRLIVSQDQGLRFSDFEDETFDILLAQSVFTHLLPEHIEECFANIRRLMHEQSRFYFTYFQADEIEQRSSKDFSQPFKFYADLASRYQYALQDKSYDYPHPRGQKMLAIAKL